MPSLYNCKHSGDQFKITKFDSDFNVESSYLLDASNCKCPAGHRPTCRHRNMLPKFIARNHVGDEWFFDYDRGGWVQGTGIDPYAMETNPNDEILEPSLTIATEIRLPDDATPDQVAEAFGNLLAPTGLRQPNEPEPSTYPTASPSTTIRRRI